MMKSYKSILDKAKRDARIELKDSLALCTASQQELFKKMYAYQDHKRFLGHDMSMTIEEVVKNLPEEKVSWAMQQVQRTLDKSEITPMPL